MVSMEMKHNIVGIVGIVHDANGNVITLGLFLSPVPTFHKIWKKKAVESFSPVPYLATFLNCVVWVFYGVLCPHSVPVVSINAAGAAIELTYLAIFLSYATPAAKVGVSMLLLWEVMLMTTTLLVVLVVSPTRQTMELAAGILCSVLGVLMYASPLVATWRVVQTRSVRFMPFWLSLASFLNGVCWTLYATLWFDLFIMIPNGLGVLLGLAQLVLYAFYYSSTPPEEPRPQVHVPTAAAAPVASAAAPATRPSGP